jgi:hypothetical protein
VLELDLSEELEEVKTLELDLTEELELVFAEEFGCEEELDFCLIDELEGSVAFELDDLSDTHSQESFFLEQVW